VRGDPKVMAKLEGSCRDSVGQAPAVANDTDIQTLKDPFSCGRDLHKPSAPAEHCHAPFAMIAHRQEDVVVAQGTDQAFALVLIAGERAGEQQRAPSWKYFSSAFVASIVQAWGVPQIRLPWSAKIWWWCTAAVTRYRRLRRRIWGDCGRKSEDLLRVTADETRRCWIVVGGSTATRCFDKFSGSTGAR
jgi:hypothetical protein